MILNDRSQLLPDQAAPPPARSRRAFTRSARALCAQGADMNIRMAQIDRYCSLMGHMWTAPWQAFLFRR
jgi:hypothetical protein